MLLGDVGLEQIFDVEETDDLILLGVAEDRQTRKAMAADFAESLGHGHLRGQGDDVVAEGHHPLEGVIRELHHLQAQLPLLLIDGSVAAPLDQGQLDLLFSDQTSRRIFSVAPPEQEHRQEVHPTDQR